MKLWSLFSWQRVRRERSAANPRMDVDWDELMDGRVRRLRVGEHYEAEIAEVEAAANTAAQQRGMVARTANEKVPRMQYFESFVWVQFADHEIEPGQPCFCGEPNPVTIHPAFARCPSCGSRLAVKRPKGSKRGQAPARTDDSIGLGGISQAPVAPGTDQASAGLKRRKKDGLKPGSKKGTRSERTKSSSKSRTKAKKPGSKPRLLAHRRDEAGPKRFGREDAGGAQRG